MPQTITIKRTTTAAPATPLAAAEPAVVLAASKTAMYIGDGTANRCLISTDPADEPLMTANYLPLAGGAMTGLLTLSGAPSGANDAATKSYVDSVVAAIQSFEGTWRVGTNTPDITPPVAGLQGGDYYICTTADPETAEEPPEWIPIHPPQAKLNNGDYLIWNEGTEEYDYLQGGSLTKPQADVLYVDVAGDTMTGFLTLSGDPTAAAHAATKAYVDAATGAFLPLAGGTLTGPLILAGDPTVPLGAATKQYVDAHAGSSFSGVVTDSSLTGTGLPAAPLGVAAVDGGTWS